MTVFLTAELMPVAVAAVVPTKVGAEVRMRRDMAVVSAVSLPSSVPLTSATAFPAAWAKLAAVTVIEPVPVPETNERMLEPPAVVIAPKAWLEAALFLPVNVMLPPPRVWAAVVLIRFVGVARFTKFKFTRPALTIRPPWKPTVPSLKPELYVRVPEPVLVMVEVELLEKLALLRVPAPAGPASAPPARPHSSLRRSSA